jgi:hypothetical protein
MRAREIVVLNSDPATRPVSTKELSMSFSVEITDSELALYGTQQKPKTHDAQVISRMSITTTSRYK